MINAFKIKAKRKILLMLLNIMYPSPLTNRQLFRSASDGDQDYDISIFKKDIAYFCDKGWLEYVDSKIGGFRDFEDKVIKLTARGKEIAEGTGIDEALEI